MATHRRSVWRPTAGLFSDLPQVCLATYGWSVHRPAVHRSHDLRLVCDVTDGISLRGCAIGLLTSLRCVLERRYWLCSVGLWSKARYGVDDIAQEPCYGSVLYDPIDVKAVVPF